jgi:hypothetical protein
LGHCLHIACQEQNEYHPQQPYCSSHSALLPRIE